MEEKMKCYYTREHITGYYEQKFLFGLFKIKRKVSTSKPEVLTIALSDAEAVSIYKERFLTCDIGNVHSIDIGLHKYRDVKIEKSEVRASKTYCTVDEIMEEAIAEDAVKYFTWYNMKFTDLIAIRNK